MEYINVENTMNRANIDKERLGNDLLEAKSELKYSGKIKHEFYYPKSYHNSIKNTNNLPRDALKL